MRVGLIVLLVVHAVVTALTVDGETVWNVFPPFRERFVYQMFSDIVCGLGIVFLLCFVQLRRKGRSLKGLVFTIVGAGLVGSFAPIIYLLIEKDLFEIK